ncbi:DUF4365 domain-containing protein [Homoserinimonas hongtaonis]|uniref:DUF4365 domain-containing protein n=1 Tax=Homoserinimonas hongtaonis TaxID=2079791 RepID=UPI000D3CA081|nr:DUF4365 domain-containing protein [Salinibacterium hongtaonis]AWB89446.1 hypothetical protein C2138_07750 [Salinibacterium hongtaonis]
MTFTRAAIGAAGEFGVGQRVLNLGWIFRSQKELDYGIDAHVEVVDDGRPSGRLIAIQIKSTEDTNSARRQRRGFVVPISREHADMWLDHSLPVLMVVHDAPEASITWALVELAALSKPATPSPDRYFEIVVPHDQQLEKEALPALSSIAKRGPVPDQLHALWVTTPKLSSQDKYSGTARVTAEGDLSMTVWESDGRIFSIFDRLRSPGQDERERIEELLPWAELIDGDFYTIREDEIIEPIQALRRRFIKSPLDAHTASFRFQFRLNGLGRAMETLQSHIH